MWPNPQETADLVTFTEKIFNGKLQEFLLWESLGQKRLKNINGTKYSIVDQVKLEEDSL